MISLTTRCWRSTGRLSPQRCISAPRRRLMRLGATEEKITLLFAGFPSEYVTALTDKSNPR
jgi:hypothetical protein